MPKRTKRRRTKDEKKLRLRHDRNVPSWMHMHSCICEKRIIVEPDCSDVRSGEKKDKGEKGIRQAPQIRAEAPQQVRAEAPQQVRTEAPPQRARAEAPPQTRAEAPSSKLLVNDVPVSAFAPLPERNAKKNPFRFRKGFFLLLKCNNAQKNASITKTKQGHKKSRTKGEAKK